MTQDKILQRGMTLVELMVAMIIALIALGAGGTLYLNSSRVNRVLQMQNHLAEDGRFALHMIQRVISQAGYRGGAGAARATDYFIATSSTQFSVKFNADGVNQIGCDGGPASVGAQSLTIEEDGSTHSLKCGGNQWIGPLGGGMGTEVADFQVEYGVDTLPVTSEAIGCGAVSVLNVSRERDCVADSYGTALSVGVDKLVAVRVCLVLRTENTDTFLESKDAVVNDCSGAAITDSQTDGKLYRTFNSTILLRNL